MDEISLHDISISINPHPNSHPNVTQLLDYLQQLGPNYQQALSTRNLVKVAVNKQYSEANTVLHENDEVAIFPPATGG